MAIGVIQSFAQERSVAAPRNDTGTTITSLQLAPAFHGFEHCDFIGVLDVAADGDAGCDAGYTQPWPLEQAGNIDRRRFPFDGGIGRDDYFVHFPSIYTAREVADPELVRPNPMEGRNRSMKHVIYTVEVPSLFYGSDVGRFFDDAYLPLVAQRTAAVGTGINICDVVAH